MAVGDMMYRIFKFDGKCFQFDNDYSADRFADMNSGAVELSESEKVSTFGENIQWVGPHNTSVDASGTISFNYEPNNNARINQIKRELESLDFKAIRPLRAIASSTNTDEDINILESLESQAAALRDELAELE